MALERPYSTDKGMLAKRRTHQADGTGAGAAIVEGGGTIPPSLVDTYSGPSARRMRFRRRRLRRQHPAELRSKPTLDVIHQCKGCGDDYQCQSGRGDEPADDGDGHGSTER